jgi:hypothetical protein
LLATDFIAYLKKKNTDVVLVNMADIRMELIADSQFDIMDKKTTIKQPVGTGDVTYNNIKNKEVVVIDYENFLDFQPDGVIKNLRLKKPDFIVYDKCSKSHFIVNELSQGNSNNKRKKAFSQMHNAIFHFDKISNIKLFITQFAETWCVFSDREIPKATPQGMADDFANINRYLTGPIECNYQPITKLGYALMETSKVDI